MLLKTNNIRVSYGSFLALRGVSLVVKKSEMVCILGTNGSGKTTLIKAICGIVKTVSGVIEFNGERIDRLSPDEIVKKGLCISPEGGQCFPKMPVLKNLMLGAFTCRDAKLIQENYRKVIELFPVLEERKRQMAGLLSGGERQMLAIGRALMGNPKLLLLDEPSMGLAPMMVSSIYESLRAIKEEGTTILMVEQNAMMSLKLADKGYVLELGEIVVSGTNEELLDNKDVKKAYIGM